jgi:hypothetical protein
MSPQDFISLVAAIFIFGMVWLRTRTYYVRRRTGPLQLTAQGRIYFGAVVALIAIGWIAAPALGKVIAPAMAASATLVRVVWFLAIYYLCIPVHRLLDSRGAAVFRSMAPPEL